MARQHGKVAVVPPAFVEDLHHNGDEIRLLLTQVKKSHTKACCNSHAVNRLAQNATKLPVRESILERHMALLIAIAAFITATCALGYEVYHSVWGGHGA